MLLSRKQLSDFAWKFQSATPMTWGEHFIYTILPSRHPGLFNTRYSGSIPADIFTLQNMHVYYNLSFQRWGLKTVCFVLVTTFHCLKIARFKKHHNLDLFHEVEYDTYEYEVFLEWIYPNYREYMFYIQTRSWR